MGVEDRNFTTLGPSSGTTSYPARTAVKLFMTFPNGGNYVGSGTMIQSRFVLTAGHCVHDKNLGGWARSITVVPAYNYGNRPYGTAWGTQFYAWSFWINNKDFNWDMGMIKLDRSIGSLTGWMGYGYNTNNSFFSGKTFYNHSYPAASPYNGQQMFYQRGTFDGITNRVVYYNRNSFGGQSGSGMYDGNNVVYAALSHSVNNSKTGSVRMSPEMYNYFKSQMQAVISPRGANIAPLAAVNVSDNGAIVGRTTHQTLAIIVYNDSEEAFEGDVPVNVRLSEDRDITSNDLLLHTQLTNLKIPAQSCISLTIGEVQIPEAIHTGHYYIGVNLDVDDVVAEDNTTTIEVVRSLYAGSINTIQVYPNPVVDIAKIYYFLQNDAATSVQLFNATGQLVATLQETRQTLRGTHEFLYDFSTLSGGCYNLVLYAGEEKCIFKIIKSEK
jgi:V8-like Glu-specific endopeptidase